MEYLVTSRQTLSAARQAGLNRDQLRISGVAVMTFSHGVMERLEELCGLVDATWISRRDHPYAAPRVARQGQFEGLGVTVLIPPSGRDRVGSWGSSQTAATCLAWR